ncbi:B3 domain-containing protein REM1-like [Salvia divinorum]|uniref:B3 domain-containing protein REM1-like n=1 Tax=Salvia divinorum TaxID=28513 RepID=A0ABD1IDQ1_SALDI
MADDDAYLAYHRLPSFIKGLPPEWVATHRDDLLFDCRLVMPNGTRWPVRFLDIASGCHFCVDWSKFVRDNNIEHGDKLTFTMAGVGIFHVKRYKTGPGAHHGVISKVILPEFEEYQGSNSLDVDSSDDYVPSETGSESADSDDYPDDRGVLQDDGYPTWTLKLTKSHLKSTIEIPYEFWQRHIRMNALEDAMYFLVDGQTWRILLEQDLDQARLVDAHDVQFYVWFDRP